MVNEFLAQHPVEIKAIASLMAIVIILGLVRWINHLLHERIPDTHTYYVTKKRINYGASVVCLIILIELWSGSFGSFSTFFGLLSAGIAIALKDLVVNVAAWVFILARRPFEVGDRIEIGHISGDVIDQRIFQFTLMEIGNWVEGDQSTGRIVHIPNQQVFTLPLANYSKGFQYIWNELSVLITFESDWEKAKMLLNGIAMKHSAHLTTDAEERVRTAARKFMIYYNNLTPVIYTSVDSDGIKLSIRYLCEPKQRRGSQEMIWEDILLAFTAHPDIRMAYSTVRIVR